ncbi:hypothetical protein [Enterococcus songbeiensis]|uniref:hypothetical protein n=1 Tax=Enterococcus songbeiensis TaxID=2559927 RepID=UPI0010F5036C|nr:hypothetical protein [Enterococcus songbeiensis]
MTGRQQVIKKLKKKIDVEYDSRTDITGHFKSEYDQGFCDGADWFFKLAEKEAVSPSLTDDQQEVLEWLQIYADKDSGDKPFQTIFFLWDCIKSNNLGNVELSALRKLTRAEQFQVLAAFAEWGSREEE